MHTADSAKQQYSTFCYKAKTEFEMEFKNYSYKESRLNNFYRDLLSKNDDLKDLWEVDDKKLNKAAIEFQIKILRQKKMKLSQEIEIHKRHSDSRIIKENSSFKNIL